MRQKCTLFLWSFFRPLQIQTAYQSAPELKRNYFFNYVSVQRIKLKIKQSNICLQIKKLNHSLLSNNLEVLEKYYDLNRLIVWFVALFTKTTKTEATYFENRTVLRLQLQAQAATNCQAAGTSSPD